MCAGGALCARSMSYFRRRRKTTEECSQLTDSTPSTTYHGSPSFLCPHYIYKTNFSYLHLLLCNPRLPKARCTHSMSYFCHRRKTAEERSQLTDTARHDLSSLLCPHCNYKTNICYVHPLLCRILLDPRLSCRHVRVAVMHNHILDRTAVTPRPLTELPSGAPAAVCCMFLCRLLYCPSDTL